jgi:hypothetical protein
MGKLLHVQKWEGMAISKSNIPRDGYIVFANALSYI